MANQIDRNLEKVLQDDGYFIINKKTIKWGISILSLVLVALWGFLQLGISNANDKADQTNVTLTALVKELDEKKVEPLEDNVDKLNVSTAVLLDRTNSRAGNTNSTGTIPTDGSDDNNPPSNTPPGQ